MKRTIYEQEFCFLVGKPLEKSQPPNIKVQHNKHIFERKNETIVLLLAGVRLELTTPSL